MPTLDWIGKKVVVEHHKQVPFHLLRSNDALSVGEPGSGNLLVQGDNLLALKALLPYYAGQVKCIYIDPPYNTGNESWVYNDNVNSPEMRAWLGKTVGGEIEDLSRHDKWLCMMYPRLALLHDFLREDGAIFISIDDNECSNLIQICDQIFGIQNRIIQSVWIKRVSPANDAKYFSSDHEFLVVYARNKTLWRPNKLKRTEKQIDNYRNPDNDTRGPWNSVTYTCNKSVDERPNLYHSITNPNTGEVIWPRKTAVWKYDAARHVENEAKGLLWWGIDGKAKMPRLKRFLNDMGDVVPRSFLHYDDVGHTQEARTELLDILRECPFTTPKPSRLIRRIIELGTKPGDIVLDSFAGSGTTGHAVLTMNNEESEERRFIMIEMDHTICQNITRQRIKRVALGYKNSKGMQVNGLGGSFRFCDLGEPLFNSQGQIADTVTFRDLAHHVFFIATGEPLPQGTNLKTPLLGVSNGVAVYLLYNGILGDKSVKGGNVLTREILASLPRHEGTKIIYGNGCRISPERLRKENIIFRQVPYEVRIS